MVLITSFIGAAALFFGFAAGLPRPRPDSSINEPAVSAPNGIPMTESPTTAAPVPTGSSECGPYGCGSKGKMEGSDMKNCGPYGCGGSKEVTTSMPEMQTTSTSVHMTTAAETKTTEAPKSWPTYGSGHSNWDMGNYNDCVQKCMATYSMPTATYMPTATATTGEGGTGATHTVIVAPTQGVLRYVPFAVNASVGDTVKFMWGANNHTVTKGTALLPCNKSLDGTFATGQQNKDFVFNLKVNDTQPVFFFCGTPTHCQKGMFAIINPPSGANAQTSVSSMMPSIVANNSDVATYAAYAASQTKGNLAAANWGNNIDMAELPDWSHPLLAQNVMYTRAFVANNKDILKEDGSIDLSAAGSNPLMIPQDLNAVLSASSSSSASAAPSSTPAASSGAAAASTSSAQPSQSNTPSANLSTSGASSLVSPRLVVTLVAAFAAWLLL